MTTKNYTVQQVADILEKEYQSVLRYCQIGRINAEKFGSVWLISEEELKRIKEIELDGRMLDTEGGRWS